MELERQPERETAATRNSARPSRLELGPAPLPPDWSSIAGSNGVREDVGAVRQRQDSGQLQAQQVGERLTGFTGTPHRMAELRIGCRNCWPL